MERTNERTNEKNDKFETIELVTSMTVLSKADKGKEI